MSSIDNMVAQQIRPWGVLDQKILDLFYVIRREDFVPARYKSLAYSDMSIPLYSEQTMFEPKVQAHLIQALQPQKEHRALLIGAGLGFMVALLSHLCQEVVAYEIDTDCFQQAEKNLQRYETENVTLLSKDGLAIESSGLFDKIVLCGAVGALPAFFLESLQVSGHLIYFHKPVSDEVMSAMKLIYKSSHDATKETTLLQAKSPVLLNHQINEPFVFS